MLYIRKLKTKWHYWVLLFIFSPMGLDASEARFWQAAKAPEHYVVMRHATAPGVGDPPQFDLADCNTQRNLDDTGRAQAKIIGSAFRKAGITSADVYSSQWCRCMDTAHLLGLGEVNALLALNSFFETPAQAEPSIAAMRAFIRDHNWRKPVVMVTHQVNITGLTGIFPASGEMAVIKIDDNGTVTVVERLRL